MTIGLQTGLALLYFSTDSRFLLPALPLVLFEAGLGLQGIARVRPTMAAAIGVVALVIQGRASWDAATEKARPAARVTPVLRRVEAMLPERAIVVTDVPMPLAWLYWARRTPRSLVPLCVPPGRTVSPFKDGHLRRLYLDGYAASDSSVPAPLIRDGALTEYGSRVVDGAPAGVMAVACTGYGRQQVTSMLRQGGLVADAGTTTAGCEVSTLSRRPHG